MVYLTTMSSAQKIYICIYILWRNDPTRAWIAPLFRFLHLSLSLSLPLPLSQIHTVRLFTARRRGRYPQNKHNRRISMPSAGFEPAITAVERFQTYHTANQIGPLQNAYCQLTGR
jgi:hypothetical protein